jgi:replication factor C small subunit
MPRLIDAYRPRTVKDLVGQDAAVGELQDFLEDPHPCAFLFTGPTGTGKTSAALALARDLGVDMAQGTFGGLHHIPAGEQTAAAVGELREHLTLMTWSGSGWKVAIIDEADTVHPTAAAKWLDVLDSDRLPRRTVFVFTTNNPGKLPARFRDRCQEVHFIGDPMIVGPAVQSRIDHIIRDRDLKVEPPRWQDLAEYRDGRQELSIRQVIQSLDSWIRSRRRRTR